MKAILMTGVGEADVLQPGEVPTPQLRSDTELLVRLLAAGVNPVDTKLRSRGTYYPDRMPAILGCDGAGVVEAVGSAVTRFRVGDAVYFCHGGIGGDSGCYAEYAVVEEKYAALKPASIDFVQAAAAPLVLITAWEALHDRAHIVEGQEVLVHAGAGGVGHVAIQLARDAGCRVATTVGSEDKVAFARELGADAAINYRDTDFVSAVRDWAEEDGVDVAFDTVGGKVLERTAAAVRPYGHIVTLLQPGPELDWKVARLRNLRLSLELMLSPQFYGWEEAELHQTWILEQCAALFDDGRLRVHVSHTLPLERAADAHRLLERGGMTGKVVLTIAEP